MYRVIILSAILALGLCQDEDFNLTVVELHPNINETPSTRIIGGVATTIERYPFTVQILVSNQLACGGSLLTRRIVLSAAHCFVDNGVVQNVRNYRIRAGTARLNSGGSTHSVSTIVVHEQYDRPLRDNDVAVVVLSSAVRLSASVAIVAIPAFGSVVPDNSTVIHVGWGVTNVGSNQASSVLNEVAVRSINLTICTQRYAFLQQLINQPFFVTSNMICAGMIDVGGRDACQGDSGGPLIFYSGSPPAPVVVGITSWGYGCAHPDYPGVNARTAAYSNWISQTVARYSAAGKAAAAPAAVLAALAAVLLTQYA